MIPNHSYFSAAVNLLRVLNNVAQNELLRPQRQHQFLTLVNRSRATPPTVVPLNIYLLNEDCISFIKRYWDNCESQMKHRDAILAEIFGSADEGWQVLEDVVDNAYPQLSRIIEKQWMNIFVMCILHVGI
jgi:hypothetical protein